MPTNHCKKDCCRINARAKSVAPDTSAPYRMVFFGATREEDWQHVTYKKKGRKARKWLGATEQKVVEEPSYSAEE